MKNLFVNSKHEENFNTLVERDGTNDKDFQRRSMFFVLASDEVLMNAIDEIYNFNSSSIRPADWFEESKAVGVMSSGEIALIKFAYNLYNGYDEEATIYDVFCRLSIDKMRVCINAIEFKYMRNEGIDPIEQLEKLGFKEVK